jgi:hypothetical protein
MSNTNHARLRSLLHWTSRILLGFVSTAVFTITALYIGTALYQYRVQQLYARALQLRVGVSSFADVQRLAEDYKRNVTMMSAGCSSSECAFVIRLNHTTLPMLYFDSQNSEVGTRPAVAVLAVRAKNANLTYVSFGMNGRSPTGRWITAGFHAATGLTMFDKCSNASLGRDSTYTVKAIGHRGIIETAFGSQASEMTRVRATNVRINCFTTALRDCNEISSLMPRAYEQFNTSENCDESFERECQQYVDKLKAHQGPWKIDSSFSDSPVTLEIWMLTRCPSRRLNSPPLP